MQELLDDNLRLDHQVVAVKAERLKERVMRVGTWRARRPSQTRRVSSQMRKRSSVCLKAWDPKIGRQ